MVITHACLKCNTERLIAPHFFASLPPIRKSRTVASGLLTGGTPKVKNRVAVMMAASLGYFVGLVFVSFHLWPVNLALYSSSGGRGTEYGKSNGERLQVGSFCSKSRYSYRYANAKSRICLHWLMPISLNIQTSPTYRLPM